MAKIITKYSTSASSAIPTGLTTGEMAVNIATQEVFIGGTVGTVSLSGVRSFNGLTGAVGGVTTSVANTFTVLQSFNSGISAAGATLSANTRIPAGATLTVDGNIVANGNVSLGNATSDTITSAADITVNSLTVGKGGGGIVTNTAVGVNALGSNSSGSLNTAIGNSALAVNTTGSSNVAVGDGALSANTTGSANTAFGRRALLINNGSSNTAAGNGALSALSAGSFNTAIGRLSGNAVVTATGGIYIGYSNSGTDLSTNEIVIGTEASGFGSNTAVIGATTQTAAYIYGLVNAMGGVSAPGGTFSALTLFTNGITTSFLYASTGSTFGSTLQVNGGATLAGRVDVGGIFDVVGGTTLESTLNVAGVAIFSAGVTLSGTVNGATASFSRLASFVQGISTAGATVNGSIISSNGIIQTASSSTNVSLFATSSGITIGASSGGGVGNLSLRPNTITLGPLNNSAYLKTNAGVTLEVRPRYSLILAPTSDFTPTAEVSAIVLPIGSNETQFYGGVYSYFSYWDGDETYTNPTIRLWNLPDKSGSYYGDVYTDTLTANRSYLLPDSSGTVALTSQLVGAVNGSTAATTAVTSFNGLTGAVGGVTTSVANTFTALQTFTQGITTSAIYASSGSTFSRLTVSRLTVIDGATIAGSLYTGNNEAKIRIDGFGIVELGDIDSASSASRIQINDGASLITVDSPYGAVNIGDYDGVNTGTYITVSPQIATIECYTPDFNIAGTGYVGSEIQLVSAKNGVLQANAIYSSTTSLALISMGVV